MDTRFFLLGRSNGNKCPQPPSQVWSLYVRQKSSFDLGIDRIPISRPVSDRMAGDYVYVRQFLSYSIWILRLRLIVGFKKKRIYNSYLFEFLVLFYIMRSIQQKEHLLAPMLIPQRGLFSHLSTPFCLRQ